MQFFTGVIVRAALCAALGLIGLASSRPALAGNLDRCDEARIAAHNTVMNKYNKLLSELDARIARAKTDGVDPANSPYRDQDERPRSVDMIALRADLQTQEARDAGRADKQAARDCADSSEPIQDIVKRSEVLATRGISLVLPKHLTNIDLSQNPLRFR